MDTTKPGFPDLCDPLEIQEVLVHEVLLLDMNLSCENDVNTATPWIVLGTGLTLDCQKRGPFIHCIILRWFTHPPALVRSCCRCLLRCVPCRLMSSCPSMLELRSFSSTVGGGIRDSVCAPVEEQLPLSSDFCP
jgi:hypothetical protein